MGNLLFRENRMVFDGLEGKPSVPEDALRDYEAMIRASGPDFDRVLKEKVKDPQWQERLRFYRFMNEGLNVAKKDQIFSALASKFPDRIEFPVGQLESFRVDLSKKATDFLVAARLGEDLPVPEFVKIMKREVLIGDTFASEVVTVLASQFKFQGNVPASEADRTFFISYNQGTHRIEVTEGKKLEPGERKAEKAVVDDKPGVAATYDELNDDQKKDCKALMRGGGLMKIALMFFGVIPAKPEIPERDKGETDTAYRARVKEVNADYEARVKDVYAGIISGQNYFGHLLAGICGASFATKAYNDLMKNIPDGPTKALAETYVGKIRGYVGDKGGEKGKAGIDRVPDFLNAANTYFKAASAGSNGLPKAVELENAQTIMQNADLVVELLPNAVINLKSSGVFLQAVDLTTGEKLDPPIKSGVDWGNNTGDVRKIALVKGQILEKGTTFPKETKLYYQTEQEGEAAYGSA